MEQPIIYQSEKVELPPFFHVNMGECKRVRKSNRYVYLLIPNHPHAVQGYIAEHQVAIEQYLGRFLNDSEVVHHIDHDKTNNSLNNLCLYPDQKTHLKDGHSCHANKELVDIVLKAASDPTIALSDLPCASPTARKILKHHAVEWENASVVRVDNLALIEDLKTITVPEVASKYGISVATIWRKFREHIVHARNPIGFLSQRHDELILDNRSMTMTQLCSKYNTNTLTIIRYLKDCGEYLTRKREPGFLDARKDEILKWKQSGVKMKEICKRLDVACNNLRTNIYRWIESDDPQIASEFREAFGYYRKL